MLLVVSDLSEVSVTRTSSYGHCRLKFILLIPCLCRQLGDALAAYPLDAAYFFYFLVTITALSLLIFPATKGQNCLRRTV